MSSNKLNSHSSINSSSRFTNSRPSSIKGTKKGPRKVLPSKKIPQNCSEKRKAISTGVINEKKPVRPKKTTKSDFSVAKYAQDTIDYCKNCGDSIAIKITKPKSDNKYNKIVTDNSAHKNTKKRVSSKCERTKPIQQYYKNENYRPSTESLEDVTIGVKKISLDTIKEVSEVHPSSASIFRILSDSEDDITFVDVEDQESIKELKEFRQNNYFECHSAKSRVRNKGSATSLVDHKCVYRFYLNDRLFAVPLNTDYNNRVRCVECHLPMDLNVDESEKINGTIQAKISLGKKTEDVMLLLPIKEPLIIKEKRKEDKQERDVVYFGIINLDGIGNSIFNPTLPADSFALKYQKGYKEFENKEEYSYRDFDKEDVIVI